MSDYRVMNHAKVLVDYSLKIKKGDLFMISATPLAGPLVEAVYQLAIERGAYPYVKYKNERLEYLFYKHAQKHQLEYVSPISKYEMENIDALLSIWASENTRNLTNIDPKLQAYYQKAQFPIYEIYFSRSADESLRWCGTVHPTVALAQEGEMSAIEYEDFVYHAANADRTDPVAHWKEVSAKQAETISKISSFREFTIKSPTTNLSFKLDDSRKWINCDGRHNFPDGEIFTCPVEDSVNGTVEFTYPAIYRGQEVGGVRLEFKNGKVIHASAKKNEAFLLAMLDMDEGARFAGEIAIGTNYQVERFTRHILFDEKIGGTFHLAIGKSLPEAGGKNISAIHWDMIADLTEGEFTGDGIVFYKNGKFII